ncbi:phage integrase family protein [Escherichia coli]|nr:phage integrase family protein [Escherichia coli]EFL8125262.1 phage integrase family protein [Escherichia coli]
MPLRRFSPGLKAQFAFGMVFLFVQPDASAADISAQQIGGVPLSVLQEMGGWESIEMVRRYAHLAPNHLTEHARQIDSILNPSVPNLSQSKNKEGTNDV